MIEVEHRGRIAILTIRRPQRRNALGSDIVAMLASALEAASNNADVGAIVLTGEAPSFCAGSDLKELGKLDIAGMVGHELETGRVARRIGMQIYQHGRMRRGSLGLETRDISPNAATELGLANRRGALITAVSPDSPAARADIAPGSVISTINGEAIRNNSDYMAHFGSSAVGEELEFGLLVKGAAKTVKLTVTDQVGDPRTASVAKSIHGLGGLVVNEIGPRSPLYGQVQGVVVKSTEPDTPAATSGLLAGDVITSVNQLNIMSANQIADLNRADAPVERVKIMRGGIPYIVDLRR